MADRLLIFAVLGLGIGVLYAGLGLGLLVTYRGANVLNFAIGAVAMWGGYVYYGLRAEGRLYFPVVGIPSSVSIGAPAPLWLAVACGIASAAALNVAAQVVIFRPLRHAPDLAKIVATVGLMLLVQAMAAVTFGSEQQVAPGILPGGSLALSSGRAPWSDIELLGIAIAVTVLLGGFFRYARTGLAMLAVAESDVPAALAGRSPVRLAAGAWALSGALAGLFGVLAAPLTGLNTVSDTLYVVPALAVLLVGRLRSLTVTCMAGVGLGVFQSIIGYARTLPWYPSWAQTGADEAVPLAVIVVVLAVSGRNLPSRDDASRMDLPAVVRPRRPALTLAMLAVTGTLALVVLAGSYRFGVIESMIAAIIMLSFVVLTGYVGQISLAQLAIAGVGGLFVAKLSAGAGLPFPLAPLLAALAAAVCGLLVAIPALRIRGMQLAIVTLAFAVTVEQFLFANPSFNPPGGLSAREPALFGLDLAVRAGNDVARLSFGVTVLAILVMVACAVLALARSQRGLRLLAVRANERAAASAGISVTASKLGTFAVASFIAGLGGALLAYSTGQFSSASFDALAAGLPFLAFAYLGGITSVTGGIIAGVLAPAGIVYVLLNRYVSNLGPYYLVASGAGLILAAIANPDGMTGAARQLLALHRRGARVRLPAPLGALAPLVRLPRPARPPRPLHPDCPPHPDRPPRSAHPPRPAHPPHPDRRLHLDHPDRPRHPQRLRPPGGGLTAQPGTAPSPALSVRDLRISYGPACIVDGVSFELAPSSITALIGPNGAGKTSIVDALTGFTGASGSARLREAEVLGLRPAKLARRGVVRTWQTPASFGDLTVAEDLTVALRRPGRGLRPQWPRPHRPQTSPAGDDAVGRLTELLSLTSVAGDPVASLPLGLQKLVALGRALAAGPEVLLLDEPAAGLDGAESRLLGASLRDIAAVGTAVLLVEHDMDLVFGVSDRVLVLDMGRLIAAGTPAEVRADAGVRRAYLGGSSVTSPGGGPPPRARPTARTHEGPAQ